MNTAILLGAGSSIPAGFPSTEKLTDLVLSGRQVARHTDASYYINGTDTLDETIPLVNSLVRRLHAEAERYYSTHAKRWTNYEDLFYLVHQALDDQIGEMENPAIRAFVKELKEDMLPLIESTGNSECKNFTELLLETRNYIADLVWGSLDRKPESESLSQLELIASACKNISVTSISTICHDSHLERYLRKQGIPLSDGFSTPEAGVRYWRGDFSQEGEIPFLKLHGSVDWFRLRPDNGNPHDEKIGIPLNGDHWHTKTEDGILQTSLDGRPLLLVGTFNKMQEYGTGIFLVLHHHFQTTINKADQLVICGYSFGDKGINSAIIDWYYDNPERRFIIIHPKPDDLFAHARGAIKRNCADWRKNRSISFIQKQFEEVSLNEFMSAITIVIPE